MDEWFLVVQWIIAQLLAEPGQPGDLQNEIYREKAPQTSTPPYVLVTARDSRDLSVVGGHRIMSWFDALVKVVHTQDNAASIHAIAGWIDDALQNKSGTVPGLRILSCVRYGGVINYTDEMQAEHLGYRYHIQVQQEP